MLKARAMYGMFKTQTICIKIYTIFHCYLMSLSQNKKKSNIRSYFKRYLYIKLLKI